MITLRRKCGEYYDFLNIKKVFVHDDFLTITANYEKGKRYKTIVISKETIVSKSLKQFLSFLEKTYKRFDYTGLCPYCDSEKIDEWFKAWVYKPINRVKVMYKIKRLEPKRESSYHCLNCTHNFSFEQLKHTNIILYY